MTTHAATVPRFATALSTSANAEQAAREACQRVKGELNAAPHLAVVFASFHYRDDFALLAETLRAELATECLLGCINEYQEQFGRGDFLVRNVQGVDAKSGAIAIGDYARVGQTVQYHVRDAATADEDLNLLLSAAKLNSPGGFLSALVFTCNGRGTRLFDRPNHDAQAVARHWKSLPVAGFFAQGEIGPVGGKNFLHGFTASIALFEAAG
ncbi:MAG: FIST C-terminal domain-containing protein [Planctomycetia bacterium]|nr:FIST C-terminal domain-containing protein [Planctomycetia bacterium]